MEAGRRVGFGLEARLFVLIFIVANVISAFITVNTYNREKENAERALADELIRAARMFSAMLDVDEVGALAAGGAELASGEAVSAIGPARRGHRGRGQRVYVLARPAR